MLPLQRQDVPPSAGPDLWVLRLKGGASDSFHCFSPCFWGVWVHWNGKTTEPCFGEKATCNGHRKELPLKWKGYLHVWSHRRKQAVFLEFTPTTANALIDQVGDRDGLRGIRFRVERGQTDNSKMKLVLLPALPHAQQMPEPKDPYDTLCKLWGVESLPTARMDKPAVSPSTRSA